MNSSSLNTYLDHETGQLFVFRNFTKTWSVALTFQKPWDFLDKVSALMCMLFDNVYSLYILLYYLLYRQDLGSC